MFLCNKQALMGDVMLGCMITHYSLTFSALTIDGSDWLRYNTEFQHEKPKLIELSTQKQPSCEKRFNSLSENSCEITDGDQELAAIMFMVIMTQH